jgi:hypothetical protein
MSPPCVTLVPDLCPRMLADVAFYTTTLHESQGHAWLNDTSRKTISDHSCTLSNAKCWRPAPHESKRTQNWCIFTHRDYVYIVAMFILHRTWAMDRIDHFYTSPLCLHSRDVYFTQNLNDGQNCCIFTHRNYVYIVAMCILHRIWTMDKIDAFLHIATMFT